MSLESCINTGFLSPFRKEENRGIDVYKRQVYRMVTKLVKLGYLEKGVMDNHANTYYLTNDGRKLFKEDKAE